MKKLCLVYVTASNREEAEKIAKNVISLKLAACANIYEKVTSLYRWEGKDEKSQEATIILKSREDLLDKLDNCSLAVATCVAPSAVFSLEELIFSMFRLISSDTALCSTAAVAI